MLTDEQYLALTLIGEARGEPIEGMVGVGNVIKNRTVSTNKSYENIVLAPKQFSCWNSFDPNFKVIQKYSNDLELGNEINLKSIRQCLFVARGIVENELLDNIKGAKNYVTIARYNIAKQRQDEKLDRWIYLMRIVAELGNHYFLIA